MLFVFLINNPEREILNVCITFLNPQYALEKPTIMLNLKHTTIAIF